MSKGSKIKLRSSDNELFEVDEIVASQSVLIQTMLEDTGKDSPIPVSNVSSKTLAMIIEYCNFHVCAMENGDGKTEDDVKAFDADFVKVDQQTLFDLILAANFMNIKDLLDLTCQTVADLIKNKTPEEIRKIFNIVNDFTPEEEAEVRRENQWAFE